MRRPLPQGGRGGGPNEGGVGEGKCAPKREAVRISPHIPVAVGNGSLLLPLKKREKTRLAAQAGCHHLPAITTPRE